MLCRHAMQLYLSTKPTSMLPSLSDCLDEIKTWFSNNFLKLEKLKFSLLAPNPPYQNVPISPSLNSIVPPFPQVKRLGVILDGTLSSEKHINNLTRPAYIHLHTPSIILLLHTSLSSSSLTLPVQLSGPPPPPPCSPLPLPACPRWDSEHSAALPPASGTLSHYHGVV